MCLYTNIKLVKKDRTYTFAYKTSNYIQNCNIVKKLWMKARKKDFC